MIVDEMSSLSDDDDRRTSFAEIRFRGSKVRHLLRRFSVSALAAVNRSRNGVLGNCPTGT